MEKYYRRPQTIDRQEYTFQVLEWHTADEENEYVIRAFGVDKNGYSVCCTILDYLPSFYIKIPQYWKKADVISFLDNMKKMEKGGKKLINYYVKDALIQSKIEIQHFKEFYGFTNNEKFKFCKLTFKNEKGLRAYKYALLNSTELRKKVRIYETNIEPFINFFHEMDIQPSNWIKVSKFIQQKGNDAPSLCQVNIECSYTDIHSNIKEYNSNFLQASYDIETYSLKEIDENGKEHYPFPIPEKKENVIYQIATCFKRFLDDDFLIKCILTLKHSDPIEEENTFVIECEDEKDLLIKWKSLIESMDPDILYQYNGDIFDCQYMVKRAQMLGISSKFSGLSRLFDYEAELKEQSFSSSAYGTTNFYRLKIPGRINFDILVYIRREFKEASYKLNSIAEKYLGEKKLDVSVQDIFRAYEEGTKEQIKRIAEYCIQDTLLPQKLVDTMHIMNTLIPMSNVTYVPIRYLIERGQQIKVLSQITKYTSENGYRVPFFEYKQGEKFQGATVLDPQPGIYDIPVTVLDFASLYPSIIRAHNLCYTTIVLNEDYTNIPDIEYMTIDIEGTNYQYALNAPSVLPQLLANLAIQRKKFKKLMASTQDPKLIQVYDKTQLAYKISMNSVYGILGSGAMGCKPIAATVTKIGRQMIDDTKNYIENNHHNVFPEGHDTDDLNEEDYITIKRDNIETSIKVKELSKYLQGEVYIKTNKGWRKIIQ